MTAEATQREILEVWAKFRDEGFPDAVRIDVTREMKSAEVIAGSDAEQHLHLWLALTDESLHFLLSVYRFAEENVEKVPEVTVKSAVAFRSLLARMCALTVAVRRLVVAGLGDAARPIIRSWYLLMRNLVNGIRLLWTMQATMPTRFGEQR